MKDIRIIAEIAWVSLVGVISIGISTLDMIGFFDEGSSFSFVSDNIPQITLLVLGTVVLTLLIELGRLTSIDNRTELIPDLSHSIKSPKEQYKGVTRIEDKFPFEEFSRRVKVAHHIRILQTFAPNLLTLGDELQDALNSGAIVQLLLLNPYSSVTEIRTDALRSTADSSAPFNAKNEINRNLAQLRHIHEKLDNKYKDNLKVRVYDSLPSICMYEADSFLIAGYFLHGKLATNSPQIIIDNSSTDNSIYNKFNQEFRMLWDMAGPSLNLPNYQADIKTRDTKY